MLPKTETMPTNPLSPYALQKLMGEQYGQMFTRLYGFETVTTRYFNVFGPRQDPGSPLLGRDLALHQGAAREAPRRRSTATAGRPATSPTSTNVVDGVIAGGAKRQASAAMCSTSRTNSRISLNRAARDAEQDLRNRTLSRSTRTRARRRPRFAGGHQQGREAARLPTDRRS